MKGIKGMMLNILSFMWVHTHNGCGGTVGAILTCPLEVVKTRLQSSSITLYISEVQLSTVNGASVARVAPGPLHCLKLILEREGPRSLFRGLGPNLVGVAPSSGGPMGDLLCSVFDSQREVEWGAGAGLDPGAHGVGWDGSIEYLL
ncbi:hypothetical protein L3Q82_006207 [Scortum barcoo]|uniref:Uncharacterized protein n=1 Tax=Scortum barcoo TaxID=214431 RepID=A0ACB8X282_9TELE|nr:hypothetical protein L3Q82_006207 [Scortum barcoo]